MNHHFVWFAACCEEMPGLSFLLKKKFHPARFDNQKRLFIAEQNQAEKNDREIQSAKEVQKEKEMQSYEAMGAMEARDPRSSALKFMYAAPQSKDQLEGKNVKVMASLQDYESKIDQATGDDDMVRAFKAKIIQSKLNKLADLSSSATSEQHVAGPTFIDPPPDLLDSHITSKSHTQSQQSALEREVGGRRSKAALTHTQLEERFACLKNAPMEGGYAKGIAVKHQPFNEVVRNVQCARCGEWGHRSGERECALKDYNPLDYARQQREDPMRNMEGNLDPRTSEGSSARAASSSSDAMRRSTAFVDENGESDPEAEFLASLTRREKMLLLRKLQVIEDGGDPRSTANDDSRSSSSSSDSSSSSSDSSSDSEGSRSVAKKRKHKHKKSSGKDKKKSKSSSHKHRRHKKSKD